VGIKPRFPRQNYIILTTEPRLLPGGAKSEDDIYSVYTYCNVTVCNTGRSLDAKCLQLPRPLKVMLFSFCSEIQFRGQIASASSDPLHVHSLQFLSRTDSVSCQRLVFGSLYHLKSWRVQQIKPVQLAFGRTIK